jgi:hypothetical protein
MGCCGCGCGEAADAISSCRPLPIETAGTMQLYDNQGAVCHVAGKQEMLHLCCTGMCKVSGSVE